MSLSEFDLIRRYFDRATGARKDVLLGIGDDAALLAVPPGQVLAVSVDTLVAEVHFRADDAPADLGYKCLAVNLSDLAATGAEPVWATLALTLPGVDEAWLAGFAGGFCGLARRFDVQLVGGDLTRGPLAVTVQVHGLVPQDAALTRAGARAGDAVCVTGTLGDAAAALALEAGQGGSHRSHLQERLRKPSPRVREGLALRAAASAAIDVSDGLLADLGHILERSKVGATVHADELPLSDSLRRVADPEQARRLALTGGDDYELCFTIGREELPAVQAAFAERGLAPLTCIGTIDADPGLRCLDSGGRPVSTAQPGYRHF